MENRKQSTPDIIIVVEYSPPDENFIESVNELTAQSLKPEKVIFKADSFRNSGRKTKNYLWKEIEQSSIARQLDCHFVELTNNPPAVETSYLIRWHPDYRWPPNHLEELLAELEQQQNLAAVWSRVELIPGATAQQKNVWQLLSHRFGADTVRASGAFNPVTPLYRVKALQELGKPNLLLGLLSDREIAARLKKNGWKLEENSGPVVKYEPPRDWRIFARESREKGEVRGRMAGLGLFPTVRDWREDRLLVIWTLLLCWNPAGWSLMMLHLFLSLLIALRETYRGKADLRLFFFFPLYHSMLWFGWLSYRLRVKRNCAPSSEG